MPLRCSTSDGPKKGLRDSWRLHAPWAAVLRLCKATMVMARDARPAPGRGLTARSFAALQPILQFRPPPPPRAALHRDRHRSALADDDDEALAASGGRVDEVSRQHRIMLSRESYDDGRIFGPLRFVDRHRIGGKQRIEFAKGVLDLAALEAGNHHAFSLVDPQHGPKIAVEDVAVVIILGLHDFVAGGEDRAELFYARGRVWIERFLKIG